MSKKNSNLLGKWRTSPEELYQVNVLGVKNLMEACINNGLRHFIYLSAGGVTGPIKNGVADESYNCKTSTPYEKTKLQGEQLALEMADKYQVPLTMVRPSFTYGPGDQHKLNLFSVVKRTSTVFIGDGYCSLALI